VDILLVEDDINFSRALGDVLSHRGFKVSCCADGIEGLMLASRHAFDAVLLDLTLPGLDGLEVLQRLRSVRATTPVIIVTARGSADDEARAFEMHADDFIAKPFDVVELEARLRALVRLRRGDGELRCGTLRLDRRAAAIFDGDRRLELSAPEKAILETLMDRRGKAASKQVLCDAVLAADPAMSIDAVEPLVDRVRERIAGTATVLMTLRGVGYLLLDESMPTRDD